jgi:cephalosporin hydroxylase
MLRDFRTFFHPDQLEPYQAGTLAYQYRGVRCLKSPIDLAIYLKLIWDARPRTIIEIGSKAGGSALYFRDVARTYGLDCGVVSIDLSPPDLQVDGVRFCAGDVSRLSEVFAERDLYRLPRPWLAIEDSAHTYSGCLAALRFFAASLERGEHLVVEDGVLDELGWAARYDGGPNRAVADFFVEEPTAFEVTSYCDMFGRNATWNPNGYLRKL